MNYRSEVDGLRAVAVLPVIFYHAGFAQFSGGFVGVDVFFVISGYLITTLIAEQLDQKRFSISEFYQRRIRRIFPALFAVVAVCTPLAWFLLTPDQMQDYAHSLIGVSLFFSNVVFWWGGDYFAPDAAEQPLLHTWSLGVEEQFYLIFPVMLLILWRLGRTWVTGVILAVALASLILSEWGWRHTPSANFYLPYSRLWELLAGAAAAFVVGSGRVTPHNALGLSGLAAIALAVYGYNTSTPWPSVYTLLPVAGTVLVLLFAGQGSIARKILSVKPLVFIGLVSYSAYLWHQPLFVFARLYHVAPLPPSTMLLLALLTLLLAAGSWRWIEQPFRRSGNAEPSFVLMSGLACIGVTTIVALVLPPLHAQKFDNYRYPADLVAARQQERFAIHQKICHLKGWDICHDAVPGKINVLVIGDSHAVDGLNTLYMALRDHSDEVSYAISTLGGCVPHPAIRTIVANTFPGLSECIELNQRERYNTSYLNSFDVIAVSVLLGWYSEQDYLNYLRYLRGNFGGKIIAFGSSMSFHQSLVAVLNSGVEAMDLENLIDHDPRAKEAMLAEFSAENDIVLLSKMQVLCPVNNCRLLGRNGALVTYDKHHLSMHAVRQLAATHAPVIRDSVLKHQKDSGGHF